MCGMSEWRIFCFFFLSRVCFSLSLAIDPGIGTAYTQGSPTLFLCNGCRFVTEPGVIVEELLEVVEKQLGFHNILLASCRNKVIVRSDSLVNFIVFNDASLGNLLDMDTLGGILIGLMGEEGKFPPLYNLRELDMW